MKLFSFRKISLLAFVFLLASNLLASCDKKPKDFQGKLSVSPNSLTFNDLGEQKLTVISDLDWSVSGAADWLELSTDFGSKNVEITVSVKRNDGPRRVSDLIFSSKKENAARPFTVSVIQETTPVDIGEPLSANPAKWDGNKRADITYQLLVYSFADSDGNGSGDLQGVKNNLDYINGLGADAIWLSPIHPSPSYHGYDVTDYTAIDSRWGNEADLKALTDAAHAKGIKVYMDYVLNHTSKDHPWFLDAKKGPESLYRDYYVFSDNPSADVAAGKIDMIATEGSAGYNPAEWTSTVTGWDGPQNVKLTLACDASDKPKTLTVSKVSAITQSSSTKSGKYLWWGDPGKNAEFFVENAAEHIYSLSLALYSPWGVLIRTSATSWENGTKYGAPSGSNTLEWDTPLTLSSTNNADILLPGMSASYYHSAFGSYMPDINYGSAASAEDSPTFKALAAAADKWISLGVDGFRLDAVKHIYHNAYGSENPEFLRKFYDHCNATYKARGGGEFYMVGEMFDSADKVAPYYKGLPALFEFDFWNRLQWAVNNGTGMYFTKDITGYQKLYYAVNQDFIEATKLSNHDEDRAGSVLGKSLAKEKLAAAVMLTSAGAPYIYQGEELGYYGTKASGDEWVRTPVKWTKTGKVASGALGGKVDNAMLTPEISVEAQSTDENSLLNVYRNFSRLRNTYPALASGTMKAHSTYNDANSNFVWLGCWYMEKDGEKMLVVHNFSASGKAADFSSDNLDYPVGINGEAKLSKSGDKKTLYLGPYSSVVFKQ